MTVICQGQIMDIFRKGKSESKKTLISKVVVFLAIVLTFLPITFYLKRTPRRTRRAGLIGFLQVGIVNFGIETYQFLSWFVGVMYPFPIDLEWMVIVSKGNDGCLFIASIA